jgi:diguanylate cyclase (GGDEF)-like protein
MMLPAFKASDPAIRIRDIILTRETVQNDVAELCVAVLVTFAIAVNPLTIVFALPFVTLLQRSFRHAHLVNASRIDSKTGLLNAGTWEREAGAEVARAVRTRTPLALALVDIDHFKAVNDTFGHLTGDRALKTIARTFRIFLREYDLVGRFGGEEFALLLPHTGAVDAYGIAERIREHIAVTSLDVGDLPGGRHVQVTVSLGVAALGPDWGTAGGNQLTDLLAAADRALYQAKRAGRDRVCVVSDNAVVSNNPAASRPVQPAEIESA